MEIAIGVVFLALFVGAFFLFVLITGFYFWRRSKRKNAGQNRQFSSTGSVISENYESASSNDSSSGSSDSSSSSSDSGSSSSSSSD